MRASFQTEAKIIIRGKGSIKEGKLGRREGPLPGENEPLHAYVTGPTHEIIKRAVNKVSYSFPIIVIPFLDKRNHQRCLDDSRWTE